MEALQCYGSDTDTDSDSNDRYREEGSKAKKVKTAPVLSLNTSSTSSLLPPPPPPEFFSSFPESASKKGPLDEHGGRVRSFPHVEGNFALHVYIPVTLPAAIQSKLAPYLQKAVSMFRSLKSMEDEDLSARFRSNKGLGMGNEFHISLAHTVPIRIHQVDTIVPMLRRKFGAQKRFWVDFGSWEVFINDDRTRSFLSLEIVAGGISEGGLFLSQIEVLDRNLQVLGQELFPRLITQIQKQVSLVDDVYRLHNLPTFYKNPRPHISLAWALGDVIKDLAVVARELNVMTCSQETKTGVSGDRICLWSSATSRVECKVGQKLFPIWTTNP